MLVSRKLQYNLSGVELQNGRELAYEMSTQLQQPCTLSTQWQHQVGVQLPWCEDGEVLYLPLSFNSIHVSHDLN